MKLKTLTLLSIAFILLPLSALGADRGNRRIITSADFAKTLPDGFGISTLLSLTTGYDGQAEPWFNDNIEQNLLNCGFKFLRNTKTEILLGTDGENIVKAPTRVYGYKGIVVAVTFYDNNPECIDLKFPNKTTLDQFIASMRKFGFSESDYSANVFTYPTNFFAISIDRRNVHIECSP